MTLDRLLYGNWRPYWSRRSDRATDSVVNPHRHGTLAKKNNKVPSACSRSHSFIWIGGSSSILRPFIHSFLIFPSSNNIWNAPELPSFSASQPGISAQLVGMIFQVDEAVELLFTSFNFRMYSFKLHAIMTKNQTRWVSFRCFWMECEFEFHISWWWICLDLPAASLPSSLPVYWPRYWHDMAFSYAHVHMSAAEHQFTSSFLHTLQAILKPSQWDENSLQQAT